MTVVDGGERNPALLGGEARWLVEYAQGFSAEEPLSVSSEYLATLS